MKALFHVRTAIDSTLLVTAELVEHLHLEEQNTYGKCQAHTTAYVPDQAKATPQLSSFALRYIDI